MPRHPAPAATTPGLSRRDFSRLLTLGAAGILLPGGAAEAQLAHAALPRRLAAGAIRLNQNENPLGPSRAALEAIRRLGTEHGRYPRAEEAALIARVAEVEGVPASHVAVFNGSSDPLNRAVWAYTSPTRSRATRPGARRRRSSAPA